MATRWQRLFLTTALVVVFLVLCSDPLLMVMAGLGSSLWPEAEIPPVEGRPGGSAPDRPGGDTGKEPAVGPGEKEPPAESPDSDLPATDGSDADQAGEKPDQTGDSSSERPDRTPPQSTDGRPVVYLTFDDGPSPHVTPDVLDILKKHQVKATFFAIGSEVERYPDLARRILAEGHVLGNHTYSHRFDIIYQSPQHYLDDLRKGQETMRRLLQYETRLTRAPGGSTKFTPEYIQLLGDDGFIYVDWNVDSGDSRSLTVPAATIVQNTLAGVKDKQQAVVIMHDMALKTTAAEALDRILSELLAQGVVFRTLDETTPTYHFR